MIEIEGFWWLVGAVVVCGWHALYVRGWRRERRQYEAWWRSYDAEAQKRHADFIRVMDSADDVDVSWSMYKNERGQA